MNAVATTREPPTYAEWNLPSRGRVAMALLIAAESAFFSIFVLAYLYYIGRNLSGPYAKDVLEPPYFITACLWASSIPISFAVRALRRGSVAAFALLWFSTMVLGSIFLLGTGMEWHRMIFEEGLVIGSNLLGTTFYSLVGFHALHVTIGLTLMTIVLLLALAGRVGVEHAERVEMLSWYWHFVDAVWVVVFIAVYIVGRMGG